MEQAEIKTCPRCQREFNCNAADIAACQCSAVVLDAPQRAYIAAHYKNCLCRSCLEDIRRSVVAADNQ